MVLLQRFVIKIKIILLQAFQYVIRTALALVPRCNSTAGSGLYPFINLDSFFCGHPFTATGTGGITSSCKNRRARNRSQMSLMIYDMQNLFKVIV